MLRTLLAEHGGQRRAVRARPGARAGAAVAPQSDRGRARVVAGAGQRPPLRRPRLQAADADRAAHLRLRLVSAAPRRSISCRREESAEAARTRAQRRAWLLGRGYTIVELQAADVETDVAGALDANRVQAIDAAAFDAVEICVRSNRRRGAGQCRVIEQRAKAVNSEEQHDAIDEFADTLRRDRAGVALAHGHVRGRGLAPGPVRRRLPEGPPHAAGLFIHMTLG